MGKKIKLLLNELTDVDVQGIALVKHAANRSPIKLVKHDKGGGSVMSFDLRTLFGLKKKEETVPEIRVACLVCKTEDSGILVQALAELKLTALETTEADGVTSANIIALGKEDGEVTFIKMSDALAVGMVGLTKSFQAYSDSASFNQNISTVGFYPGVRMATDAMMETLFNIMFDATAGEPPVEKVRQMLTDFSSYVVGLTSSLPVTAFKLEKMEVPKVITEDTAESTPVEVDVEKAAEVQEEKPAEIVAEVPEKEPVAVEAEETVTDSVKTQVEKTEVATQISGAVAAAISGFSDIAKKQSEDIMAAVTAISERITKTEESLKGIVSVTPATEAVLKGQKPVKADFNTALRFPGFD